MAIQKQEALEKVSAMNEKKEENFRNSIEECKIIVREGVDQAYREYKKEVERLRSGMKSMHDSQMWWVKHELDILKDREKRRSKQRREKRLRKRERQAAARGLNRMDNDANQADEE